MYEILNGAKAINQKKVINLTFCGIHFSLTFAIPMKI